MKNEKIMQKEDTIEDFCSPCLDGETEVSDSSKAREEQKESLRKRCFQRFSWIKPPKGQLNLLLTVTVLLILCYALLVSLTPRLSLPLPFNETVYSEIHPPRNGSIFLLYILFVSCLIIGFLFTKIRLPELLGMLLVGIVLRNLPFELWVNVNKSWVSVLRKAAFVVILVQGGLGLDIGALRRLKAVVLRLSFLPCIAEAATVAITAHLILDFPWIPGFLMGFMLGAVSPAVCVPSMLDLQEKGFGVVEGIPTLVIAASSIDDVFAITGFSVLLSLAFSQGGLAMTILKGPIDVFVGVVYGIIMGWLAWYLPEEKSENCTLLRYILILSVGLVAMFSSGALGLDGAGSLGCLVAATVAAAGWSKKSDTESLASSLSLTWIVFQPFLFGLIGGEINLKNVELEKTLLSLLVLLIGLIIRTISAFFSVMGENFTIKDRIFISLAWLPKATVQAVLGPIYYDTVISGGENPEKKSIGLQILTMAVLAILVTAPLGAALISLTGPHLLKKSGNIELKEKNDLKDSIPELATNV